MAEHPVAPGAATVHTEHVMGTVVSFTLPEGAPEGTGATALARAVARLHQADALFSTWRPDSPLSRLRQGTLDWADCPAVFDEVAELCERARRWSAGWFDPWAMPGGFDPTGLVKGWAVARARDELARAGVPVAMVNGGGDIDTLGAPAPGEPWRIGIQHPWLPDALACVVGVERSVATSAGYHRGPHLLDPASGRPSTAAASATVTGPSLALADALATGLAVGGDAAMDAIESVEGYEAYLVRTDGSERLTGGIRVLS